MQNVLFEESMKGLYISRVVRDFKYTMPDVHIHYNHYEVYYLLEGERYYFIGTKIYHLKPGSLVLIRRNVIHKTAIAREAYHDRILLEISHSYLEAVLSAADDLDLSDFFQDGRIVLELDRDEQEFMKKLFFSIKNEIKNKDRGFSLLLKNRVAELFVFAKRRENRPLNTYPPRMEDPRHRQVEKIACYIAENYSSPLSLQSVADHFYMNKCYLSRIFKEITGFTVNGYLHTRRIQKARALLIQGGMNISQISEAAGYENLTYFERVFKKHTGMSPLKYRKQYEEQSRRIADSVF